MMLAELSIWPMDKGQSVSPYVARALEGIRDSGLEHQLGPLGTVIEGEPAEVWRVIAACHEALAGDSDRVMCSVKTDWRRGRSGAISAKVQSVQDKLA
jgi:uncharacterized protein (TIGR00106 family)